MQGVIAAVPTPVDDTGRPQRGAFLEHCRWALENGCDGLNILGSTGEANSLDTATRRQVMSWAAEGLDTGRLMVGTGTPSLAETVALTAHADDLGYPVALVLPPYYYTPPSEQGLIAWYGALHRALGPRRIAVYFYNYPQMTGFPIPAPVIEALHRAHPDRFRGIKDSSGDLGYCRSLVASLPDLRVFPSNEAALAEAAVSGFAGCISATANVSAPLCGALWEGREAPDADLLQTVSAIRQAVSAQPLIPAVKHMVMRRSADPVWDNVLPPFLPLPPGARDALATIDLPAPAREQKTS
ncbi:dihydrodipicolinate synthase family protein [Thalassovita mangrovi]|uniref:Dihydrodipicolinate synthase family protein n=1 Tax=Thalassovita mangrovi TaxID=2692236 RepID=A0A6L8LT55_9RHOB|nr:dihydrodipicolinate synthase family protein [Thalassovita mangrovi]MYM56369.1 dihydrodipicolinate synthase family protein [Thalassovita mangrovi]